MRVHRDVIICDGDGVCNLVYYKLLPICYTGILQEMIQLIGGDQFNKCMRNVKL